MNPLEKSLIHFKESCNSTYVTGDLENRKAWVDTYKGLIPLSQKLKYWYSYFCPVNVSIPWGAEGFNFFNFDELEESQIGYRWCVENVSDIDEQWNESWVVIGDFSADPLIVDVTDAANPVFFALHGIGKWELKQISYDLEGFFVFMSSWINNVIDKHHFDFYDENYNIKPEVMKSIQNCLNDSVESSFHSNVLEFIE